MKCAVLFVLHITATHCQSNGKERKSVGPNTAPFNTSDFILPDDINQSIAEQINQTSEIIEKTPVGSAAFMHLIRKVPIEQLKNRALRVLIPGLEPPYVNYENFTDAAVKEKGYSPGVVIEILKDIGHYLNLTYYIIHSNDTRWGNLVNGTWSGAFGMLHRGEVDLIAGGAIMQYDRSLISDLTYPFQFEQTGMMIRAPVQYSDNTLLIVTEPFKWEVWGLTAFAIIISGLVLKGLTRSLVVAGEIQYSNFETIWVFFSIFVQQGLPVQPHTWTTRILLSLWWLSSVTLMATFTGSLVALFAVQRTNLPFSTIEGMVQAVKAGRFTILMDINTQSRSQMIATSSLQVFKELWYEMSVNRRVRYVDGLDKAVEIVKHSNQFVLLGPQVTLQYYAYADCELEMIPGGIIPTYLSIPLQKNSEFSTFFSVRIRELLERGFVNKWLNDYSDFMSGKKYSRCNRTTSMAMGYLNLSKAQGAFWVLLLGLGAATVFLIVEHLWKFVVRRVIWVVPPTPRADVQTNFSTTTRSTIGLPSLSSTSVSTGSSLSSGRNPLRLTQKLDSLSSYPLPEVFEDKDQSSPEEEDIIKIVGSPRATHFENKVRAQHTLPSVNFRAETKPTIQRFHSLERASRQNTMFSVTRSFSFPRHLSTISSHELQSSSQGETSIDRVDFQRPYLSDVASSDSVFLDD